MTDDLLSGDQISELGVDDWRSMYGLLEARFATGDFAAGLRLVTAIGAAAEAANHHPDVTLTSSYVHVVLTSHDVGGKTVRDVDLAREISRIADGLGLSAEPSAVQRLELSLDTSDLPAMVRFWAAALELEPAGDEVTDPARILPTIWFQETDAHDEPRQRWHLDIRVPPDRVHERIAAALAAGGTLVSDDEAPRFWVVADPEGNKVCYCTHLTRQH